jgi:hypothetical protein
MELEYDEFGNLIDKVFTLSWDQFKDLFGYTEWRQWLLQGMELAIADLKKVGCKAIYADGSFVTKKESPGDFDLCWEDEGIDLVKAWQQCPSLFDGGRKMQKIKDRYRGDVVPANNTADTDRGISFLGFFMEDKEGREKGIIRIEIA